jgi:hypothetical protein
LSPRRLDRRPDPEQQRKQARANELMLAVGARLLGEARLTGEFPTEDGELGSFVARLAPELEPDEHVVIDGGDDGDWPRSDYKVLIRAGEPDSVGLSCRYGSHFLFGRLRMDGVLDEGGFGVGVGGDDPAQRVELSPVEQEVLKLAFAAEKEARGGSRPVFGGAKFLRALAVPPQAGAAVQIVAVELYDDGLLVSFTYDDPVDVWNPVRLEHYDLAGIEPPIEAFLAEAEAAGGNLAPNISVSDDLGTRYVWSGGGHGGVSVAHGETNFTPAVPAAATRLVVSSYAGTVEVDLRRP